MNWPEIPGYEIQEKLAEGGMGVVYAAVDTTLDRKVAIKMIRPELGTNADGTATEEGVGRFLNEAKAAAKIQSAHVARVLHFGRTDTGELYLILEFLEGSTLGQLLRRESRLKPPRAVKIVRQICRGLKAAHDLGIVHRDLKPANIMLIDQDGDPEFVKILDFGVAKLLGEAESGLTQAGALVGTYTSMAPEQVQGGTIDARTDIYALGVLLFRLLTGQPPFSGTDPALILHHHCFKAPPRLREVVPAEGISPALEAVVLQCLAKDPSQRISSMAELERRLEALASDDSLATDVSAFAAAPTDVSDPTAIASASPISAVDSTVHDEGEDVVFTNIGSGIASGLATVDGSSADAESSGVFQSYSDPPTPMTGAGVTSAAELSGSVNTPDKPEGEAPVSWLRPAAAALTLLVLLLGGALVWLVSGGGEEHETPPVASAPPVAVDEAASTTEVDAEGQAMDQREGARETTEPEVGDADREPSEGASVKTAPEAPERSRAIRKKRPSRRTSAAKADTAKAKKPKARTKASSRTETNKRKSAKKKTAERAPTEAKAKSPVNKPRGGFVRVRTQDD